MFQTDRTGNVLVKDGGPKGPLFNLRDSIHSPADTLSDYLNRCIKMMQQIKI